MSVRSKDLQPGDMLIYTGISNLHHREAVLSRRKETDDGWWVESGGGLADTVIDHPDSKWVVAS